MLYSLDGTVPTSAASAFLAPGARVIGDVRLEADVSVWFNAVIRGDNDSIVVGAGSNVQDGAVLHVDPGFPMRIGTNVTVGHKAMLHGCTIGEGSLIGMNAVVLNGAVIGRNCLIGANALVTEGMEIPDGSLVLGSPAKVRKTLDAEAIEGMHAGARSYVKKIAGYRATLAVVSAEPNVTMC
mgnify:CR=1 FL=1